MRNSWPRSRFFWVSPILIGKMVEESSFSRRAHLFRTAASRFSWSTWVWGTAAPWMVVIEARNSPREMNCIVFMRKQRRTWKEGQERKAIEKRGLYLYTSKYHALHCANNASYMAQPRHRWSMGGTCYYPVGCRQVNTGPCEPNEQIKPLEPLAKEPLICSFSSHKFSVNLTVADRIGNLKHESVSNKHGIGDRGRWQAFSCFRANGGNAAVGFRARLGGKGRYDDLHMLLPSRVPRRSQISCIPLKSHLE